jgi:hypothetical protein
VTEYLLERHDDDRHPFDDRAFWDIGARKDAASFAGSTLYLNQAAVYVWHPTYHAAACFTDRPGSLQATRRHDPIP